MAKPKLSSLVVVSVDLGAPHERVDSPELRRAARELGATLDRRKIAATWALPDFDAGLIDTIRQTGQTQHELALVTDSRSVKGVADSFQYSATLRFQVEKFRAAGIDLSSIAADPKGQLPYHTLSKLGFRTMRPTRYGSSNQVRPVQPQTLRYGLWGLAVSSFWPHRNRFMHPFMQRHLVQQLTAAADQGHALHVVIDAQRLGHGGMGSLERLLDTAARLRDEHGLQIGRMVDVEKLVKSKTAARPAKSILRRAAA